MRQIHSAHRMKSGTDMHITPRRCNATQVFLHTAELVSAAFFAKKAMRQAPCDRLPAGYCAPKYFTEKISYFPPNMLDNVTTIR